MKYLAFMVALLWFIYALDTSGDERKEYGMKPFVMKLWCGKCSER